MSCVQSKVCVCMCVCVLKFIKNFVLMDSSCAMCFSCFMFCVQSMFEVKCVCMYVCVCVYACMSADTIDNIYEIYTYIRDIFIIDFEV